MAEERITSDVQHERRPERQSVEMPRPNVWPMVVSLGIALVAAGVALHPGFIVAGGLLLVISLAGWVEQLLPGRGHHEEELAAPELRAQPVQAVSGRVEQLHPGRAGYRFQLPEKVHPISAGIKGGLLGGLVMPVPALLWGLLREHSLWYPVNLLAGMVLPGVENMSTDELKAFHFTLLVVGIVIHVVNSGIFGLLYGVLLPTCPDLPRTLAWGALLMPILWSGVSFAFMSVINPDLADHGVSWPWFIFSQFIFGLTTGVVFERLKWLRPAPAALASGLAGGALMPVPAILWSLANRHSVWYPINLLAGLVLHHVDRASLEELHPDWLAIAVVIHLVLSATFGLIYGLILPRLPAIPTSIAWGGLLMPLLWTGIAYSLMGVVNKLLQAKVDWPWFIVSQFVFGIVAAVVVHRSEKISVDGAGRGQER